MSSLKRHWMTRTTSNWFTGRCCLHAKITLKMVTHRFYVILLVRRCCIVFYLTCAFSLRTMLGIIMNNDCHVKLGCRTCVSEAWKWRSNRVTSLSLHFALDNAATEAPLVFNEHEEADKWIKAHTATKERLKLNTCN